MKGEGGGEIEGEGEGEGEGDLHSSSFFFSSFSDATSFRAWVVVRGYG